MIVGERDESGHFSIPLDKNLTWELIVNQETGTIGLACVFATDDPDNPDRFILPVGHMDCAGIPNEQALLQGVMVIACAGQGAVVGSQTIQ